MFDQGPLRDDADCIAEILEDCFETEGIRLIPEVFQAIDKVSLVIGRALRPAYSSAASRVRLGEVLAVMLLVVTPTAHPQAPSQEALVRAYEQFLRLVFGTLPPLTGEDPLESAIA